MAPSTPINWGIAGTGPKSKEFIEAIKSIDKKNQQCLAAVAGQNLHNVTNFAKRIELISPPPAAEEEETAGNEQAVAADVGKSGEVPPKLYGNFKELAHDEKVTAVYVNSPAPNRAKVAQLMLENGKHVVVEPPMAPTLAEASELVKLAQEKKLLLLESVWMNFSPAHDNAAKIMKKGRIGQPLNIVATSGTPCKKVGILSHISDCLRFVLSTFGNEKPSKISVTTGETDCSTTNVTVILHFPEGRSATFVVDVRADLSSGATVAGSLGTLQFGAPFSSSNRVSHHTRGKLVKAHEFTSEKFHLADKKALINEVRGCINEGKMESEVVPTKLSLLILEMVETVAKEGGIKEAVPEEGGKKKKEKENKGCDKK